MNTSRGQQTHNSKVQTSHFFLPPHFLSNQTQQKKKRKKGRTKKRSSFEFPLTLVRALESEFKGSHLVHRSLSWAIVLRRERASQLWRLASMELVVAAESEDLVLGRWVSLIRLPLPLKQDKEIEINWNKEEIKKSRERRETFGLNWLVLGRWVHLMTMRAMNSSTVFQRVLDVGMGLQRSFRF